jgi:hypothetical protein
LIRNLDPPRLVAVSSLDAMSALPPKADIALHRSECPLYAKSGHHSAKRKAQAVAYFVFGLTIIQHDPPCRGVKARSRSFIITVLAP